MPKLPIVSGKNVIKKLQRIGYFVARQKGSHARLINETKPECKPLTVPIHKIIKQGLLSQILKDANLSIKQFLDL